MKMLVTGYGLAPFALAEVMGVVLGQEVVKLDVGHFPGEPFLDELCGEELFVSNKITARDGVKLLEQGCFIVNVRRNLHDEVCDHVVSLWDEKEDLSAFVNLWIEQHCKQVEGFCESWFKFQHIVSSHRSLTIQVELFENDLQSLVGLLANKLEVNITSEKKETLEELEYPTSRYDQILDSVTISRLDALIKEQQRIDY